MSEPKVAGTAPVVLQLDRGVYFWCACGRSENQPWCDGSHEGSGIKPFTLEVEATSTIALCVCKQTGDRQRCDGSHSKL